MKETPRCRFPFNSSPACVTCTRERLHLDLKPANIFVTTKGVLKIGDLGLCRTFEVGTSDMGEADDAGVSGVASPSGFDDDGKQFGETKLFGEDATVVNTPLKPIPKSKFVFGGTRAYLLQRAKLALSEVDIYAAGLLLYEIWRFAAVCEEVAQKFWKLEFESPSKVNGVLVRGAGSTFENGAGDDDQTLMAGLDSMRSGATSTPAGAQQTDEHVISTKTYEALP